MKDNKGKKTTQKSDGDNVAIIRSNYYISNMYKFTMQFCLTLDVSDILDI